MIGLLVSYWYLVSASVSSELSLVMNIRVRLDVPERASESESYHAS
jgi:hypothetical protein